MSLYNNNFNFNISKKNKKNLIFVLGIIILVIIITILISTVNLNLEFLKQNPIKASFEKNPLDLSKKNNTLMEITVKNNYNADIEKPRIIINSVENGFSIYCNNALENTTNVIEIEKISAKNKRTVNCDIRVIDEDILEGTYSFDIDYYINEENYKKRMNLKIRK